MKYCHYSLCSECGARLHGYGHANGQESPDHDVATESVHGGFWNPVRGHNSGMLYVQHSVIGVLLRLGYKGQ